MPTPQGLLPPPPARGGLASLAYGLRWGMMDSDRAELGLMCGATGWLGSVGGEKGLPNGPLSAAAAQRGHAIPAAYLAAWEVPTAAAGG